MFLLFLIFFILFLLSFYIMAPRHETAGSAACVRERVCVCVREGV